MKIFIMKIKENELKGILTEAVYRILSELDWKTYNSAANKDKNLKRADKFADARNQAFNKDFGFDDDNASIEMQSNVLNKQKPQISIRLDNDSNVERFTKRGDDKSNMYSHSVNNKDGYNNSSGYVDLPSSKDNKVARKMAKAHDEFDNFDKGNFKYSKGSGYKNISDTSAERPDGTPNTKSSKAQDWHKFLQK